MIDLFTPLAIPLWRMIHPARHRDPFSGEGARLYGGRWNSKGRPALYLATSHVVAVDEYYQGAAKPGTLVPYRLEASAIADLTGGHAGDFDRRLRRAMTEDWKTLALIDGEMPEGWALAEELIAAGAEGVLVPSVQNRGGVNLVLWRWHDAAAEGEGAALSLVDPERVLI